MSSIRSLINHAATPTDTSTRKRIMAAFSAGVVLMAMVLTATPGSSPAVSPPVAEFIADHPSLQ
ncbi:MAG: hypothetical protein R6U93_05670 [Dehalococcoidia bacterium]